MGFINPVEIVTPMSTKQCCVIPRASSPNVHKYKFVDSLPRTSTRVWRKGWNCGTSKSLGRTVPIRAPACFKPLGSMETNDCFSTQITSLRAQFNLALEIIGVLEKPFQENLGNLSSIQTENTPVQGPAIIGASFVVNEMENGNTARAP